jgi:hypothetical protein
MYSIRQSELWGQISFMACVFVAIFITACNSNHHNNIDSYTNKTFMV